METKTQFRLTTTRIVVIVFLLFAIALGVFGFYWHININATNRSVFFELVDQFYANISSEIIGMSIVVLVIENISEREKRKRDDEEKRKELSGKI